MAAEEKSAEYTSATIYIYLINGDHYMTRNFVDYDFTFTKRDQYSLNKDIYIQPVFWGQTIDGQLFEASSKTCIEQGQSLTVYYQLGNDFKFDVPKSLTVSNIIFDALDSSLDPTLSWLLYKSQWCMISGTEMTPNPSNPEALSSCEIFTYQSENCLSTIGNSLFQFQFNEDVSMISEIGILNIQSWTFKNFFYDFTSLIGLIDGHGHVSISDSTFSEFRTPQITWTWKFYHENWWTE